MYNDKSRHKRHTYQGYDAYDAVTLFDRLPARLRLQAALPKLVFSQGQPFELTPNILIRIFCQNYESFLRLVIKNGKTGRFGFKGF